MHWYTSEQIPDRAGMINGRDYVKSPLEAIACTTQQTPEEPYRFTKVEIVGSSIVADNEPIFNIPLSLRVTWLDACYDQINRLNAAWIEDGILQHYWYDPTIPGFQTTAIGPADRCFLFMDDVRFEAGASPLGSRIVLLYEHAGVLYQREQSDRYTTVETIATLLPNEHVVGVGMNSKYRVQIVLQREATELDLQDAESSTTYVVKIDDTTLEVEGSILIFEE